MLDFTQRRIMMVDTQIRPSDVTKFPIIEAMLQVPRETYVPPQKREIAYVDDTLEIAPGRALLEPRALAKMLDALDVLPSDVVLDIGCGLGYSSAVIARLADVVIAVEEDEGMASEAQQALAAEGADNAIVLAGPLAKGAAQHGPYDVMALQGGVEVIPSELLEQLKEGGRIGAIFLEGAVGTLKIGYKVDGAINWRPMSNMGAPLLSGFGLVRGFVF